MRLLGLRAAAMALVIPVALGAGSVVSSSASASDSTWRIAGPRLDTVRVIETLGDSVPSGHRCDCTPFPELVASHLASVTAPPVQSYNDAVPSFRSGDVLAQLQGNPWVRAHVRAAQVVVVEIGANDVSYDWSCGTSASCYTSRLWRVSATLTRIVATIRALTAGHPVAVVLLGYWNVWLDGRYAAARGSAYVRASDEVTWATNAVVRSVAARTSSAYADLWLAFRGLTMRDDTGLLAPDGDHPNAAGHAVIAAAVLRVLRADLSAVPFPPVRLSRLVVGARGGDVATYQEALRAWLVRARALGSLGRSRITGRYDAATSAMTRAVYVRLARATGDASWLEGDLDVPGPDLVRTVLGLRLA